MEQINMNEEQIFNCMKLDLEYLRKTWQQAN